MMANHEFAQGSEEWINYRLGRVTASRVSDIIAQTKSGPGHPPLERAMQLNSSLSV